MLSLTLTFSTKGISTAGRISISGCMTASSSGVACEETSGWRYSLHDGHNPRSRRVLLKCSAEKHFFGNLCKVKERIRNYDQCLLKYQKQIQTQKRA